MKNKVIWLAAGLVIVGLIVVFVKKNVDVEPRPTSAGPTFPTIIWLNQ